MAHPPPHDMFLDYLAELGDDDRESLTSSSNGIGGNSDLFGTLSAPWTGDSLLYDALPEVKVPLHDLGTDDEGAAHSATRSTLSPEESTTTGSINRSPGEDTSARDGQLVDHLHQLAIGAQEDLRDSVNNAIKSFKNQSTASRRREQNKLAQQRLRDRKKEEKKELERKASAFTIKQQEVDTLRAHIDHLEQVTRAQAEEIASLRRELAERAKTPNLVPMELGTPVVAGRTSGQPRGAVPPSILGGGAGALEPAAVPSVLSSSSSSNSSSAVMGNRMALGEVEKVVADLRKALSQSKGSAVEKIVRQARARGFWALSTPLRPEVNPMYRSEVLETVILRQDAAAAQQQQQRNLSHAHVRRRSCPALLCVTQFERVAPASSRIAQWGALFSELALTQNQIDLLTRHRMTFLSALRGLYFERAALNKLVRGLLEDKGSSPMPAFISVEDIPQLKHLQLSDNTDSNLRTSLAKLAENLEHELNLRARYEESFHQDLTPVQIAKLMVMSCPGGASPIMLANTLVQAKSIL